MVASSPLCRVESQSGEPYQVNQTVFRDNILSKFHHQRHLLSSACRDSAQSKLFLARRSRVCRFHLLPLEDEVT
jgi:hypothetical protein